MSSNAEKRIRVAKPMLNFRIYAFGVLVLYLSLLRFFLTQIRTGEISEHLPGVMLALAVLCLCIYVLARAHGVYLWNDDEIRYITLSGSRSMRWDQIAEYDVRRFLGGLKVIILRDAWGKRLKVYSYLLRAESPVHGMLTQKLTQLEEALAKEVEAVGEARFPLGLRALPWGAFIVRGDKLIHKRGRKQREVVLTALQRVSQSWRYDQYGAQSSEVTELVSKDGTTLEIPSATRGYDRLIAYVRYRATSAAWFTPDRPEPESGPRKVARVRDNLRRAQEWRNAIFAAGFFVCTLAVYIYLTILGSGRESSTSRLLANAVERSLLGMLTTAAIWWLVKYRRERRQLQKPAAQAKREGQQGDDTRSNRANKRSI